jgi:hypothetical protein
LQDSSQIYLIRTFIMKAGELTPLVSFFWFYKMVA